MDAQIKRGIIELLVISLLTKKDYYGYILMEDVSEFLDVSDSALYPILRRLETDGCLQTYSQECNGRLRKYYKITEKGVQKLAIAKNDWKILKKIYNHILGGEIDE